MAARNSEALDVLLRVAADPRVSWRTVELAGRGISADAASAGWVMSEGKHALSGEDMSDLLIEQGDLVDALAESWQSFETGTISGADFETALERVVLGFEDWMARATRK
ncbi:hypothetical protein ACIG5E_19025 [Kitasatospora sp. NPDC053057]|uniref:hypothetical protein n=1 Tax=Kitasatospora sp. NPDC053057 TaxID=3364062 RepID=UPI0037CC8916